MSNEKELSVLIKMRADIDTAINKVNSSLDSISKRSNKSTDSMAKGFKKALQPVNDIRLAALRFAAVWGFVGGSVIKIVNQQNQEIIKLDALSFKLGYTTDELSKKMFGFNIATDKARIGISSLNIVTETFFKRIWNEVKTKTTETVGFVGQMGAFLGTEAGNIATGGKAFGWNIADAWGFTGEDLKRQNQEIKENSAEALAARVTVENKIRQIKLSSYEYQKVLLAQEVNDLRIAGVSETKLREYQSSREQELLQQRFGFKKFSDFMDSQFSSTITSMKGTMSGFFNDAFTGQLKKGKEYFAEFGQSILKTFSDVIAEMITRWIFFTAITGLFGGGQTMAATALAAVQSPVQNLGKISVIGKAGGSGLGAGGGGGGGFADGGWVGLNGPERVLVGERGEPELIIPKSKLSVGGGSQITIHNNPMIVIKGGNDDIRKQVESAVVSALRFNNREIVDAIRKIR